LSAPRPETTITPFRPVAFDSGVGNNETISPRPPLSKRNGRGGGGKGRGGGRDETRSMGCGEVRDRQA